MRPPLIERLSARRSNGNVSFVWTEARLAEVFKKMLSAVAYLHQRGIAHRHRPTPHDPQEKYANANPKLNINVI